MGAGLGPHKKSLMLFSILRTQNWHGFKFQRWQTVYSTQSSLSSVKGPAWKSLAYKIESYKLVREEWLRGFFSIFPRLPRGRSKEPRWLVKWYWSWERAVGERGTPSLEEWVEGGRYTFLTPFTCPASKSSGEGGCWWVMMGIELVNSVNKWNKLPVGCRKCRG